VRDCDDITGMAPGFLRIQVRSRPDNEQLVEALHAVLQSLM
jgi:histidinol-phosphate/aromatic aminotransferase/cobyric acid decarboxylase-like protein